MRRRIYWLLPDLESAKRTMDDLLLARIGEQHMHFVAREGADMTGLHAANVLQTSDVIRAAQVGLVIGGAVGALLGVVAAFMTAFYISRVMFMTFHGEPRAGEEAMHHAHESPWVMLIPLIVLAIGAAFLGFVGFDFFVGDERADFWKGSILVLPQYDPLAAAEGVPALIRFMPLIFALVGIGLAYLFYIADPRLPVRLAAQFRAMYLFLLNKW